MVLTLEVQNVESKTKGHLKNVLKPVKCKRIKKILEEKRNCIATAWLLAKPYWKSSEKRIAWTYVSVIIILNILTVHAAVLLNEWSRVFYNALQALDKTAFLNQVVSFFWLLAYLVITVLSKFYCLQHLQMRWQRWMVHEYLRFWLKDQAYYRMQMVKDPTDNPDQRLSDDIGSFIAFTLVLSEGVFSSFLTLVSFSFILWSLSGALPLWHGFCIPGYLFWAALLYAGGGTWITLKIGRPLIKLDFNQEKYMADFRYSLVRLRENTEAIALYRGEKEENKEFKRRFNFIVQNFYQIVRRSLYVQFWFNSYNNLDNLFPTLMMAPRFFRGEILFGAVMQVGGAFRTVRESLSFIVSSYFQIASWQAVIHRLAEFKKSLEEVYALSHVSYAAIEHTESLQSDKMVLNFQDICLPSGKILLQNIQETFHRGERVLISGPSGVGKSTLFRAVSGIWPFGHGNVSAPKGEKILFIPQYSYMPLGSLKTVLTYPSKEEVLSSVNFEKILDLCFLSHLEAYLNKEENWARVLSGGEQQRVAFARALIMRPQWLFLDEATSAMDEELGQQMYEMLKIHLKETTFVSISHRMKNNSFHIREIILKSVY